MACQKSAFKEPEEVNPSRMTLWENVAEGSNLSCLEKKVRQRLHEKKKCKATKELPYSEGPHLILFNIVRACFDLICQIGRKTDITQDPTNV